MTRHVVIVGAGIFGVTASIALRSRGDNDVTLVDPGPIPHPLAESTDISKVVRLEYGADAEYTAMMKEALDRWRAWNARWSAEQQQHRPLFHETGVMFLTQGPMQPGGFEHDSYEVLRARGHQPERLDANALRARFPEWNADRYVDGYYNPEGGWAESGAVVARLLEEARALGVRLVERFEAAHLVEKQSKVTGVTASDGSRIDADIVIVAAGSWTPHLIPTLGPHLRSVGQPVFHLSPSNPGHAERFNAKTFPVFGADIARTGYYGFPIHNGVVKIANHGIGREMHPESDSRLVNNREHDALRGFLRDTFLSLVDTPIAYTRVCVYCDTWDQHFWIAPDPDRSGLVVAAGGSGHAFKFAPLVGDWIADAVDGVVKSKFRWRTDVKALHGEERARHQGDCEAD